MKIEYKISMVYAALAIHVLAAVPPPPPLELAEPIQVLTGPNETMRTIIEGRELIFLVASKVSSTDLLVVFMAAVMLVRWAVRIRGGIFLNICGWAYAAAQMTGLFSSKVVGFARRVLGVGPHGGGEIVPLFPDSSLGNDFVDSDHWDMGGSDDDWQDAPQKLAAKK